MSSYMNKTNAEFRAVGPACCWVVTSASGGISHCIVNIGIVAVATTDRKNIAFSSCVVLKVRLNRFLLLSVRRLVM